MPEPTANNAAEFQDHRSGRALRWLVALLALILVPAGIYALHVVGQLEYIRGQNLRGLESAAQAADTLLETTRANVENLREDTDYACTLFQRQTLLKLVTPRTCTELKSVETLNLETDNKTIEIVGSDLRIEIRLDAFLEQIPVGGVFDRLLIVDEAGALLGSAISPQRSSPMLPPRDTVKTAAPPVRALDLAKLKFVGHTKDSPITFGEFGSATFAHPVELAGTRYTLMCQPWRVAADTQRTNVQTWRLCGLIDGQRSFQQALEVAPHVVMVLLVLLTLAIVSWPILKVLSLAPRERIRFADMYLMLLATLTLTMIFAVAVADIGTYSDLRERSRMRLKELAEHIEGNLRAEFEQMYDQLRTYDDSIAGKDSRENPLRSSLSKATNRVGCLLLPPGERKQSDGCQGVGTQLDEPKVYEHLQSVFWMQPCDAMQIIKGAVRPSNTPAIALHNREYFQAIKRERYWRMSRSVATPGGHEPGEPLDFFVDTSASITTGEFITALSIRSQLEKSDSVAGQLAVTNRNAEQTSALDCSAAEKDSYAAALTGQPVSVRYPILAPGVGFAIVNHEGRALFHSDERRAVVAENLLADDGLADRLRAALAGRAQAQFYAQYQTRPHQIHVRPMRDIPWFIVAFVDDEVLRTLHVELLAQTGILVTAYLALALLGTLLYMLFRGRAPPVWVWPRRERQYRRLYSATVWCLGVQLILFLLVIDWLQGAALIFASVLLPLPALLTIVLAGWYARKIRTPPSDESAQPADAKNPRSSPKRWRDPLRPHIVCTTIFWLLLGALPAYGLYKFALENQMTVATKGEQAYLARAYAWRGCQIQDDFRRIPAPADAVAHRIKMQPSRGYSDIYPSALLSREVEHPDSIEPADDDTMAPAFWEYLANIAPVYNETTTHSRYLGSVVSPDSRWSWGRDNDGVPVLVYQHGKAQACDAWVPTLASRLPMLEPHLGVYGLVSAFAFLPLLLAWVSFGARKLFFGDIEEQTRRTDSTPEASADAGPDHHLGSLALPPDESWVKAEVAPIDLHFSEQTLQRWSDEKEYATRRAVVDSILEKAHRSYESRWKTCSEEDRLLLIQLVEEGFANPKQAEVVRKLLKAGLLRLDPVLRPMNQSFALFVEQNAQPEAIRRQEQAHRGLRWSLVRTLLIGALLLIMVFLALTQRDVVDVWIAYLTTAGAGTVGVLKLLGLLSKPSAQKSE